MLPSIPPALTLLTLLTSPIFATTLTLTVPPSPQIQNPASLSPSTHAVLTTLGTSHTAPLSKDNTFVFRNVTAGSYLGDIYSSTHLFAPLRIDVPGHKNGAIQVWETFRGNDWGNKGEEIRPVGGGMFPVRVLGAKVFYMERGSFSVLSILKNPMILMGLVSLGLFIGMPKLMENMDPEMRAEFEEQSKNNPMNTLMAGPQQGGSAFDMAGFLAGQGSKAESEATNSGNGKKGGKR
ncbi:hypothetical protein GGS21DRAFT_500536 [Xylaria nigripes]|nr:hypothetical protein GGS21DRAFT_500536 [Xylaria nigripes]